MERLLRVREPALLERGKEPLAIVSGHFAGQTRRFAGRLLRQGVAMAVRGQLKMAAPRRLERDEESSVST